MNALDSSIIVAALLSWHDKHDAAARAVERALGSKGGMVIPSQALFESYAVMTRLPAPFRLAPADALKLLVENFAATRLLTLKAQSVWPLLRRLATSELGGGLTYDAIILEAAVDGGATQLLTLNERDYERLEARLRIVGV